MVLRNYDNLMVLKKSAGLQEEVEVDLNTERFGDGCLSIKLQDGEFLNSVYINSVEPFRKFCDNNNEFSAGIEGCSNLICGYIDEDEVTYNDYSLMPITNTNFVSHQSNFYVYNDYYKTWYKTYTKTYCNNNETNIIVNCIGVVYSDIEGVDFLVYKKKLDTPLTIAPNETFALSFTTKVNANPNRELDYDADIVLNEVIDNG